MLHLHAREIVVPIYKNRGSGEGGKPPVPEHMRGRLAACGWAAEFIPLEAPVRHEPATMTSSICPGAGALSNRTG